MGTLRYKVNLKAHQADSNIMYGAIRLINHLKKALRVWLREAWNREFATREDIDKSIQDALFYCNRA